MKTEKINRILTGNHSLNHFSVKEGFINYSQTQLIETALLRGEANLGLGGSLLVTTGKHTGRSPKDKFTVFSEELKDTIWWENNPPISEDNFQYLKKEFLRFLEDKTVFVKDVYACAESQNRLKIRFINCLAWHSLFVGTLFNLPTKEELACFEPDLIVINAPDFKAVPERHGCISETVIATNFSERLILIGGTQYVGENKKCVFGYLNYAFPQKGILSMHCSANHAKDDPDDTALFFGLSGTGKTTLSADPNRILIGDDEHGWSDRGIFNIEGGCYAKTNGLNPEYEPDLYETTRSFGSIIENMTYDPVTREPNYQDTSITQNGRCSFPLKEIPYASETSLAGHPKNIFFLTCDVHGILPPITLLTPAQAMYHFLSGFTSKVAGTETGVDEPSATFSACFGKPFLPLSPVVYGKLFREKAKKHNVKCWLVNTGWTGGRYSIGKRISIKHTRAILSAVLNDEIDENLVRKDPFFGFLVPLKINGIPDQLLNPRDTWKDPVEYDLTAGRLKEKFRANFKQFDELIDDEVKEAML